MKNIYDTIIIGAGPAGLTAALYAARYKLKTLVISSEIGGLIMEAHRVENFPGFKSISGMELMNNLKEQVTNLNVKIINEEVKEIKKNKLFTLSTSNNKYQTKTVILALGTKRRKLNIPTEDSFLGKGVSYCATCDAPLFKNKIVVVVGGSDSACMAAQLLTEYAKKVHIIYRREKLRAEPIRVEAVLKDKRIEVIYKANVKEIKGKNKVEELILDTGKKLKVDGIFVEIGTVPIVVLAKKLNIVINKNNYIIVDATLMTNVPGVFAAGDITTSSNNLRQVVTAAAEGAISAQSAYTLIKHKPVKYID